MKMGKSNNQKPDFSTFKEVYYIQKVIEAILESYYKKTWVKIY